MQPREFSPSRGMSVQIACDVCAFSPSLLPIFLSRGYLHRHRMHRLLQATATVVSVSLVSQKEEQEPASSSDASAPISIRFRPNLSIIINPKTGPETPTPRGKSTPRSQSVPSSPMAAAGKKLMNGIKKVGTAAGTQLAQRGGTGRQGLLYGSNISS